GKVEKGDDPRARRPACAKSSFRRAGRAFGADLRCGDRRSCHAHGGRMIRPGPITSRSAVSRTRLAGAAMLGCATLAFTWTVDVAAQAADMPPPLAFKAPAAAPAFYDWSGFYVGGHLGDAWGSSRWTANSAGAAAVSCSVGLFWPV